MKLEEALAGITGLHQEAMEQAEQRWSSIAKPLHSLGLWEPMIVRWAGITGTVELKLEKSCVVVMCADNGVVAEGVTQTDSKITAVVAANMARNMASINHFARIAGADVLPVDMGMVEPVTVPGIYAARIASGTANMAKKPAMSREQAIAAVETGIAVVGQLKEQGYDIIATGEMGIGNTTTSSAVAAVLLGKAVSQVTGRGAGLSSVGLQRKIEVIEQAIALHQPDASDGLDVLHKVGGLDIAGLVGLFIGGAVYRLPVIVDGVISAAAALTAVRICPLVQQYLLASHLSGEPAGQLLLEALELQPIIHGQMGLGEGTGAVMLLPMLQMALEVFGQMVTFSETAIDPYQPQT